MTIDGVDILDQYGLKLLREEGLDSLPARKKVLSEPGFEAKDIVFDAVEPVLVLFGRYADASSLISNLRSFETLLKSDLKHVFESTSRGWNFTAACPAGTEGIYNLHKKYCILTLKLEVTA